jgi:hypothetical protein
VLRVSRFSLRRGRRPKKKKEARSETFANNQETFANNQDTFANNQETFANNQDTFANGQCSTSA